VLAPILMMFHSKFVLYTFLGRGVKWASQRRSGDDAVDWEESILTFAGVSAFALIWAAFALWINPTFFLWISPVLGGIALAIPFSIITAGTKSGRKKGFFATKEELNPPWVLTQLDKNLKRAHVRETPIPQLAKNYGLLQSLLDPSTPSTSAFSANASASPRRAATTSTPSAAASSKTAPTPSINANSAP
jgi:membrane glycosyltransferase